MSLRGRNGGVPLQWAPICGKDNKFRGKSGLRIEWSRVEDIYIFVLCHFYSM